MVRPGTNAYKYIGTDTTTTTEGTTDTEKLNDITESQYEEMSDIERHSHMWLTLNQIIRT